MPWTFRLAGLVAALGFLSPAANAQELTRLRVLLAFDTSDKQLGKGLEKHDLPRVARTLRGNIPARRLTIDVLRGKSVTREQILAHYRGLKSGPNEGLLFFYGGHGATDKQTGRHALTLTNEDVLFRYELREAMEATRAGLVVMITDCCSDMKKISKVDRRGNDKADSPGAIAPTFRRLFFLSRGTVDINASSREFAWGDDDKGGLFTRSFCACLTRRGEVGSWKEFFLALRKDTEGLFQSWAKEMRSKQQSVTANNQTPLAFLLGRDGGDRRTYAAVTLTNRKRGEAEFRWRWVGQQAWQTARMKAGEQKLFKRQLPGDDAPLSHLELLLPDRKPVRLEPRRFRSVLEPTLADTQPYSIRP